MASQASDEILEFPESVRGPADKKESSSSESRDLKARLLAMRPPEKVSKLGFQINMYKHMNYVAQDQPEHDQHNQGCGTVASIILVLILVTGFFVFQVLHKTTVVDNKYRPSYSQYMDMLNKAGVGSIVDRGTKSHKGTSLDHPVPVCPCTDQSIRVSDFSTMEFEQEGGIADANANVDEKVGFGGRFTSIATAAGQSDRDGGFGEVFFFSKSKFYRYVDSGTRAKDASAIKLNAPDGNGEGRLVSPVPRRARKKSAQTQISVTDEGTECACDNPASYKPHNHFTCADDTRSGYCNADQVCKTAGKWNIVNGTVPSGTCVSAPETSCRCDSPGAVSPGNHFTCDVAVLSGYCADANTVCNSTGAWKTVDTKVPDGICVSKNNDPWPVSMWSADFENLDTAFTAGSGKTYFFKGDHYWLWDDNLGRPAAGYPRKIASGWPGLPDSIDAAVTTLPPMVLAGVGKMSDSDGKTYFFKGSKYWSWNDIDNRPDDGFEHGKNISSYWSGVPDDIDEALFYGDNGGVYFFKGDKYWKWDYTNKQASDARSIADNWKGMPTNINAAFTNSTLIRYWNAGVMGYGPEAGEAADQYFRPTPGQSHLNLGVDASMRIWNLLQAARKEVDLQVSLINDDVLAMPLLTGNLMDPEQLQEVVDTVLENRKVQWEKKLKEAYDQAAQKMSDGLGNTAFEKGLFGVEATTLQRMMVFAETRNTTKFSLFLAVGTTRVTPDGQSMECLSTIGQVGIGGSQHAYDHWNDVKGQNGWRTYLLPCKAQGSQITYADYPCLNVTRNAYVSKNSEVTMDEGEGFYGAEWVSMLDGAAKTYGDGWDCYLKAAGNDFVAPAQGVVPFVPFARDPRFDGSPNPGTGGGTNPPPQEVTSACEVLDEYFSNNGFVGGPWRGGCIAYPMSHLWAEALKPFNGTMWNAWKSGWATKWELKTDHSKYYAQCKPLQCTVVDVEGQSPAQAILLTVGVVASVLAGVRTAGAIIIARLRKKHEEEKAALLQEDVENIEKKAMVGAVGAGLVGAVGLAVAAEAGHAGHAGHRGVRMP